MRPFNYVKCESLADAAEILESYDGTARPMAGGTDLLGGLKDNIHPQYPDTIVNLKTIEGLSYIRDETGKIEIGALTTLKEIADNPLINKEISLLAQASAEVASPQIRNVGTLAGNICQEPRCWYYRSPDNTFNCLRKGGEICNALSGDNRFHSVFGSMRVNQSNCTNACPASTRIPDYLALVRAGDYHKAAEIVLEANPMPAITGRICPHFCQYSCARQGFDESVSIRNIERFMGDYILENEDRYYHPPEKESGNKVAVIGSGPSGLATAFYLRKAGHTVTVFELQDQTGGMLRYGIPPFRLSEDILNQQIRAFQKMGIEFKTGFGIGQHLPFEDLKCDFDAVYIANGAWQNASLGIKGEEYSRSGLDFLIEVNKGQEQVPGQKVIVIGGGNVAVDVAVTAKKLGSAEVIMVCLEARDEMPASIDELDMAERCGVTIKNSFGPSGIIRKENGMLQLSVKKCISVFDEAGQFNPGFDESEVDELEADAILLAIGQKPDSDFLENESDFQKGLIRVDESTQATDIKGVFAGGDSVTGPASVVEALAAGRRGSDAISGFLGKQDKPVISGQKELNRFDIGSLGTSQGVQSSRDVFSKSGLKAESPGMDTGQILREANRCFNCGCIASCPSDLAPVLLALDAEIQTNRRIIPAEDFFSAGLMSSTVLERGELVKNIGIPTSEHLKTTYLKFRIRKAIDFPILSVAIALEIEAGLIKSARIALGASAPIPLRAKKAEAFITGKKVGEIDAAETGSMAVESAIRFGKNGYKVTILKTLVKRAVKACLM